MDNYIIQWMNMNLSQSYINKRSVLITFFVITACTFLLTTKAAADMFGIFKKYEVHLCPEIKGQIKSKGIAIKNVKVFRSLTYGDDKEILEETVTNSDGYYHFNEKNIKSKKPGSMFDESSIRQIIDLDYQDKRYLLWGGEVKEIKPNPTITLKLSKLDCDLSSEEKYFEFSDEGSTIIGVQSICRW